MSRALWITGGIVAVLALAGGGARMVTLTREGKLNEAKFAPVIAAAEKANGIPAGVLHRLIATESRFRTDIITGKVRSPVGAIGIAQFMPATAADEGVDPLDPVASIHAAGRYLRKVYGWVGNDWTKAVAGYNWGAGNVRKAATKYGATWLSYAPTETKNYVKGIIG